MFLKSYLQPKTPEKEHKGDALALSPGYYHNPFKQPASFLENNCLLKSVFMGVTSYVMGLGFGAFMHVHSTEGLDYGLHRSSRSQMKLSMLDFSNKVKSTARGFASFGVLYAIFDCQLEKMRKKTDLINGFVAGGLTMVTLALDTGMKWRGLTSTFIFGGLFTYVMEGIMDGYTH
jgi:hypothetical protein